MAKAAPVTVSQIRRRRYRLRIPQTPTRILPNARHLGHETESICRRYAIVDESMHREAAALLDD
jgi:hypothetical protein